MKIKATHYFRYVDSSPLTYPLKAKLITVLMAANVTRQVSGDNNKQQYQYQQLRILLLE